MKKKEINISFKTIAAWGLLILMAVGVFLPWYSGSSLAGLLLYGLGLGGSLSGVSWGELGSLVTMLFVIVAAATVASLLFAVRAAVTSLYGRIKGLTPAGTLISVLAICVLVLAVMLDGIGSVQVGLWLCLIAGAAETTWGIFN